MPTPKRQEIIDAIIARMQTILISGGFNSDLGNNVKDSEVSFDQDELPALSVFDLISEDEVTSIDSKIQWQTIPIQLKAFVASGTPAATARLYLADLQEAIKVDDRFKIDIGGRDVGLFDWTRPTRAGFERDEESLEIVGVIVEFEGRYKTGKFSAYDQT